MWKFQGAECMLATPPCRLTKVFQNNDLSGLVPQESEVPCFVIVSGVNRAKIEEVTLDALRTRQSLVKGERLVRHEMRAVLQGVSKVHRK